MSAGEKWGESDRGYAASEAMRSRWQREILDRVLTAGPLERMMRAKMVPLTRWQRVRNRLAHYGDRIVTAYRVLRGDDLHQDCDR